MKTIRDYIEMLNNLQALGQTLLEQEYENDEPAEWVDEVECMDIHLDCAKRILEKML